MLDKAFTDGLPFLCRPENIARYDDGVVTMLDRRCYPFEIRFETCAEHYHDNAYLCDEREIICLLDKAENTRSDNESCDYLTDYLRCS